MDSFIVWLAGSLFAGAGMVLFKLWGVYKQYQDEKFSKQIEKFQNDTDLGEKKIHENVQNMSNDDLASSAKDIASAIRNKP